MTSESREAAVRMATAAVMIGLRAEHIRINAAAYSALGDAYAGVADLTQDVDFVTFASPDDTLLTCDIAAKVALREER